MSRFCTLKKKKNFTLMYERLFVMGCNQVLSEQAVLDKMFSHLYVVTHVQHILFLEIWMPDPLCVFL